METSRPPSNVGICSSTPGFVGNWEIIFPTNLEIRRRRFSDVTSRKDIED